VGSLLFSLLLLLGFSSIVFDFQKQKQRGASSEAVKALAVLGHACRANVFLFPQERRQCKYTNTVYTTEKGREYLHYQLVIFPDKEAFSVAQ